MNLLLLAFADIRRKKGVALSLILLVIPAVMFLCMGISLVTHIRNNFIQKFSEYNAPHVIVPVSGSLYMPEYAEFFADDTRTLQIEVEDVIGMAAAKSRFSTGTAELGIFFLNAGHERTMLPFIPVGTSFPEGDIWLPVGIQGVCPPPGSDFTITYKNRDFPFVIAGYFESPVFGTSNSGILRYVLSEDAWQRLYAEVGGMKIISVTLSDTAEASRILNEFRDYTETELSDDPFINTRFDYDMMVFVGTFMLDAVSLCLFLITFIILVIILIVTRFRIVIHIEDSMRNIGVLKAIGYSSFQIILSLIIEFLCIGIAGWILGVLVSTVSLPVIEALAISASGVLPGQGVNILPYISSGVIVFCFIILTVFFTALKIRSLLPIYALRGGIAVHNFRKNRFSLEKKGPLPLKLAGKTIALHPALYCMLVFVFAAVAFTFILISALYLNMVADKTAFTRMLGMEVSDILVTTPMHTDAFQFASELEALPFIRKTAMADMPTVIVDGISVSATVSDDFEKMEILSVYEGVLPKYANEIAVTGVVADSLNKKRGDTVTVKSGGIAGQFIITGITQSTNMMGKVAILPLAGMQSLESAYRRRTIAVYLEDGVDTDKIIEELGKQYGMYAGQNGSSDGFSASDTEGNVRERMANLLSLYGVAGVQYALGDADGILLSGSSEEYKIEQIQNFASMLEAQTDALRLMMSFLLTFVVLISSSICAVILYLAIQALIGRQQVQFGILKALGYTGKQLVNMLVLSILPVAALGAVAGCVIGMLSVNELYTMILYRMGLSSVSFSITPYLPIVFCLAVILYCYPVIRMAARNIKYVTVCKLLTE